MSDNSFFLITTANEKSWKAGERTLALGEWCHLYRRKEAWEKLNPEIVPYHWDDRQQLYADYLYLHDFYEKILQELTEFLNQHHRTHHSKRYWRILVGPWLLYFTQMLFDRYQMIQKAAQNYSIHETWILDFSLEKMIPRNMDEFRTAYFSDNWNHMIYGQILEGWTSVPCRHVPVPSDDEAATVHRSIYHPKPSLKGRVRNWISNITQLLSRWNSNFILTSYLPLKQEILLQLKLGQFPAINSMAEPLTIQPDVSLRKSLRFGHGTETGFEACLKSLIPLHLPTVYLEGYQALQERIEHLPWPRRPRVIWTASNYNADDIFKAWAAEWVENGASLVIGQHGGNLGTALWTSSEDHEVAIADRYLTWGWNDGNPKHFPVGVLKQVGMVERGGKRDGKLLLVSSVMPRYSYVMGSFSVAAGQTEENLEDQFRFLQALPAHIFKDSIVRTFYPDWEWSQFERWKERFPTANVDPGKGPIASLMQQTRIYVATYNATTLLESLSLNIPTVMFWRPEHWELRSQAEPYFEKLKNVGIFHHSPEAAASHVAKVWDRVEDWWSQNEVQQARKQFCQRYALMDESSLDRIKEALATVRPIK